MIDENGNWVGFASPKESPFSEKNRYLDREGIRETFCNSLSKLGVKIPFPKFSFISSMVQNRPPSSSSLGWISPS